METAFLCIQCVTPDREMNGTFICYGVAGQVYTTCTLASPVFADLASLAPWLEENGWSPLPYDPAWPVGRYARQIPS